MELLPAAVVRACVCFTVEILLWFHSWSTMWFLGMYKQGVKIKFQQMHFYGMIIWILCCTAWTKIVGSGQVPFWLYDPIGKFLKLLREGWNSVSLLNSNTPLYLCNVSVCLAVSFLSSLFSSCSLYSDQSNVHHIQCMHFYFIPSASKMEKYWSCNATAQTKQLWNLA